MSLHHPLTTAVCLAALSCSSCVSFQAKPLSAARSAADLQGRTLHDAELRKFIAQNSTRVGAQGAGWGLGKLTLAALWLNPNVVVARAEGAPQLGRPSFARSL